MFYKFSALVTMAMATRPLDVEARGFIFIFIQNKYFIIFKIVVLLYLSPSFACVYYLASLLWGCM